MNYIKLQYSVTLKKSRNPLICTAPLMIGTILYKDTFKDFVSDYQVQSLIAICISLL